MPLAKTKEDHAELLIASTEKNEKKYKEMLINGSTVIVQRYTTADVIQKSSGVLHVHLLDGKHKDTSV